MTTTANATPDPDDDSRKDPPMSTQQLHDWALYLAAMGWHVFPLAPNSKRPAVRDWEHRATTDPNRITRCWQAGPFNIGLACGPSRLIVVDLDTAGQDEPPDGAAVLAELADARGVRLPDTYTVTTPSGGRHLYFAAPPGVHLRNTAGLLGRHIDTRAEGGYVVAAGSLLPNGGYELADDTNPAELPAWLIQTLLDRPPASPPRPVAADHAPSYVAAALHGETDRVRTAPRGQHNESLSRAAYALGQLIGAGLLDHTTARTELLTAADALIGADCDCTPREVTRVIDARLQDGIRRPRQVRPEQGGHAA